MLANIMAGAQNLLTLDAVLALVAGTVGGMVIGALPGFSAAMGVSLLIPITYGMNPVAALTMLVAMYTSAIYGGSITCLLYTSDAADEFMSSPRPPRLCRYCH